MLFVFISLQVMKPGRGTGLCRVFPPRSPLACPMAGPRASALACAGAAGGGASGAVTGVRRVVTRVCAACGCFRALCAASVPSLACALCPVTTGLTHAGVPCNRTKYVLRYGKRRTYTAPDNSVYPSHRPTSCDSLTLSLQRQGLGETASIAPRARRLNAGILWRNAPPRQRV